MPRTALTKKTALGAFGTYSAGAAVVTMNAGDATNGNSFVASANDLVIVRNSGAGARTITFSSVADEKGRTGDITAYSLAAGAIAVFGPFTTAQGWRQSDGNIYITPEHAEVLIGVIALPG